MSFRIEESRTTPALGSPMKAPTLYKKAIQHTIDCQTGRVFDRNQAECGQWTYEGNNRVDNYGTDLVRVKAWQDTAKAETRVNNDESVRCQRRCNTTL